MVVGKVVIYALHRFAVIHENHRPPVGNVAKQPQQCVKFVFFGRLHLPHLQSVAERFAAIVGKEVKIVWTVEPQEIGHILYGRGRCEQAAREPCHALQYARHFVVETEFERLVKLVKYQQPHRVHVDVSAVDVVEQPPGCAYHYRWSGGERVFLVDDIVAAIAAGDFQLASGQGASHAVDLLHKFARRGNDGALHRAVVAFHGFQHRQQVGNGLSGACWRQQHHVAAGLKAAGHGLLHGVKPGYAQSVVEALQYFAFFHFDNILFIKTTVPQTTAKAAR